MPIIRVGVQAPQGSSGQVVDLDGPRATISSIANVSAESIAYSLDGGNSWTTLVAGASGGGATVNGNMLRLRKVASGAYPAIVDVNAETTGLSESVLSNAEQAGVQALVSGDANRGVVVYGATPAGCAAAIAAARQGKPVILLSESARVGGMLGWGINHQDVNTAVSPSILSGFARELLARVGKNETVNAKTWQRWHRLSCDGRPSWFIRAMNELLSGERNIQIVYNCGDVVGVSKGGTVITSVTVRSGGSYVGAQFIDASYTGDLMAAAGCTFSIGREANATYSETSNGIRTAAAWTPPTGTALSALDPYVTAGVAGSGLLPNVDGSGLGTTGAADGRVMLFNFRLFVTNAGSDRVAFPLPDLTRYNPLNYELLGRAMNAQPGAFTTFLATSGSASGVVTGYQNAINANYFDLNSRNGISTNYPNQTECREYITATESRRAEIRENVKQWILGLFYWLRFSGDSRIPAGVSSTVGNYGLSSTELQATGGFSPELYVREGRRVVGDYVFDENDFTLANGFTAEAIAWAFYDIDSHMVRIVNDAGVAKLEGSILSAMSASAAPQIGSAIPYKVLLPKVAECTNLLCPGSPSMSRVAWSSLRMEPILMMFGQAAGCAAALAIDVGTTVQAVSTSRLLRLTDPYDVWDGIVLGTDGASYTEGTLTQSPAASWATSATRWGFVGTSALSDSNTGKGKTLTFAPNIQETGSYEVLFRYPPDATGRANNLNVTVNSVGVATVVAVNQVYPGGAGGAWESLGTYTFRKGTPSADTVVINTTSTTDFVVASAIKWRKVGGA